MFSGYNCEPINRTFVGHEYRDNVLLRFQSLNMAENYLATSPKGNDTVYVINLSVLANKSSVNPFIEFTFDDAEIDSKALIAVFEAGEYIEAPILSGQITARATHKEVSWNHGVMDPNEWTYTISSGVFTFGEMIKTTHRLYNGDRWVWRCKEVFFEFDAKSEDGKIIHVTEGHCKL